MTAFNLFMITLILMIPCYVIFIRLFNRHKIGQIEREVGLKSHKAKTGTATMGGVIFSIVPLAVYIIYLMYSKRNIDYKDLFIIVPFILSGILGFIDDYKIIKYKRNDGIKPLTKFIIQCLIAIVAYVFFVKAGISTQIKIFSFHIDLSFLYSIVLLYLFIAGPNAINLTDGIDGLVGMLMSLNLVFFIILANQKNMDITFMVIMLGALIGFLLFNYPKASIFMGNVGAYSLGSLFISFCILLKEEMAIILFGTIFIIETLSVMLQVFYFKKTKGKRIFKMAPMHHHFELCGHSEKRIIWTFFIIQTGINIIYMVIR